MFLRVLVPAHPCCRQRTVAAVYICSAMHRYNETHTQQLMLLVNWSLFGHIDVLWEMAGDQAAIWHRSWHLKSHEQCNYQPTY